MSINKTCAISSWISLLISVDISTHNLEVCAGDHLIFTSNSKRLHANEARGAHKLADVRLIPSSVWRFYFGAGEAASSWKRGSFRSGSNIGSSRSSAGVSGTFSGSGPAYG